MGIDKVIQKRKSVKRFSEKNPDWRDIITAIDASRYAPMSGNNFSLKFVMVNDKEKISEIAKHAEQDFIENAKYVVVVCTSPSRTKGYGEFDEIFLRQQAGAGIQNILLKLTELGLATSWVGLFNEKKIKDTLKIPEGITIEAILPIGYESKKLKSKPKRKIDLNNVLYFEKYGNKKMK